MGGGRLTHGGCGFREGGNSAEQLMTDQQKTGTSAATQLRGVEERMTALTSSCTLVLPSNVLRRMRASACVRTHAVLTRVNRHFLSLV